MSSNTPENTAPQTVEFEGKHRVSPPPTPARAPAAFTAQRGGLGSKVVAADGSEVPAELLQSKAAPASLRKAYAALEAANVDVRDAYRAFRSTDDRMLNRHHTAAKLLRAGDDPGSYVQDVEYDRDRLHAAQERAGDVAFKAAKVVVDELAAAGNLRPLYAAAALEADAAAQAAVESMQKALKVRASLAARLGVSSLQLDPINVQRVSDFVADFPRGVIGDVR